MKKLQQFDSFKLNENDARVDYSELLEKLSLPIIGKEHELTQIAEDASKRTNYDGDMARYICYKMLAECNDSNLAKTFLRMCNEIK